MTQNTKKRLTIVGRGVDPAKHLTLDAIRALRSADRILGIEPEHETWLQLRAEFDLPEIESVASLYQDKANDFDNYRRFIDYALELTRRHSNVALLVAGHPRLGVTFLQLLSRMAPADVDVRVIEGISSFDVMMNLLAIDALERGTVLVDANRLLLFQYSLEPALGYFVYHVCSVGNSRTDFSEPSAGNRLDLLQRHLLRFYRPEKTLHFCKASNGRDEPSRLSEFRLSELNRMASEVDFGTTLYIPSESPSRLDRQYLELLR